MITIRELIEQLEDLAQSHGDDTEVRLAHQPQWPFEYAIAQVVAADPEADGDEDDDDDDDGETEPTPVVVYIGEGSQLGYLSGMAANALGWWRR